MSKRIIDLQSGSVTDAGLVYVGNASGVLNYVSYKQIKDYVGGGGGSQNLQQVTATGNTTTNGVILSSSAAIVPLVISSPASTVGMQVNMPQTTRYDYLHVINPFGSPEPTVNWEEAILPTANGDGTYDMVHIQGWNIDSQHNGTQPSWTVRQEYQYVDDFYEYHLQWSNVGESRTYRLLSYTFTDHGSSSLDACLAFFTAASFEFRPLTSLNSFCSFGYNVSTDTPSITLNSTAGAEGVQIVADHINHAVNISAFPNFVASLPLQFGGWSLINFFTSSVQTGGELICSVFSPYNGGSAYSFYSNGNDLTFAWIPNIGNRFSSFLSNNTGEWSDYWQGTPDYFRQFVAGSTVVMSMNINGASIPNLPLIISSNGYISITATGQGSLVSGLGFPFQMITNVSSYTGQYQKNTNSAGASINIIDNDRGGFTTCVETVVLGSTSTLYDTIFGIASAHDWVFHLVKGSGSAIGTYTSAPQIFATNNAERARFTAGGDFLIGTTTDGTGLVQIAGTTYISSSLGIGKNPTTSSFLNIAASSTSSAQINFSSGSTLTSPNDGDVWYDGSHINLRTKGISRDLDNNFYNVRNFGAKGDGSTDDTVAIQAAINACNTRLGGTIYFPNGIYIIGGALVTSDTNGNNPNSQLYIPANNTGTGAQSSIKFKGESAEMEFFSYFVSSLPVLTSGTILKSTLTTGSGTRPGIFGTIGFSGSFNPQMIYFEDMVIMASTNGGTAAPVITPLSFYNAATVICKNVNVRLDIDLFNSINPSGSEVAGMIIGHDSNNGPNIMENTMAMGFKYGYIFSEHTILHGAYSIGNFYGALIPRTYYTVAGRLLIHACPHGLYFPTSSILGSTVDLAYIDLYVEEEIDDASVVGAKWYATLDQITDTGNNARGNVVFRMAEGGSGADRDLNITVAGAKYLNYAGDDFLNVVQYGTGFSKNTFVEQNVHFDMVTGNWNYVDSLNSSCLLQLSNGGFYFSNCGGGTAGSTINSNTYSFFINPSGSIGLGGNLAPTSKLDLAASSTSQASLRFYSGSAPTSPNTGDMWLDPTGSLKIRINGVTKTVTLT